MQTTGVNLSAKKGKRGNEAIEEEIEILEEPEEREIYQDTNPDKKLSCVWLFRSRKSDAYRKIQNGTENDKGQKSPIPPSIKDITGNYHEKILSS